MDKQQSDAVAEALLAPHRERQQKEYEQKLLREAKLNRQRWRGVWALTGCVVGAGIGFFTTGSIGPASLIGLALGALIGTVAIKQ